MGSMGSSDSKDPTAYLKITQQCQTHRVFTDSQGKQYDKYLLYIDRSSNESNLYQHRKKNRFDNVVDVYFSDYRDCIFGCQYTSQNYQVVTQHLSLRLHQMEKLNFLTAVNLLQKSIKGFNTIYKYNGPFQVSPQMIGVNSNTQVKVWLSKDLWKNTLDNTNLKFAVQSNNKKEAKMVNSIINVINMKAQQCIQWNSLISLLQNNINSLNFIDCLAFIERYCAKIQSNQKNRIFQSSTNKNIKRQTQPLQMKNSNSCKYFLTQNVQERNRGISSFESGNRVWKANQFSNNINVLKSSSPLSHPYLSNTPKNFVVGSSPFHYNCNKISQYQPKAIYNSNEFTNRKLNSINGLSKNLIKQRTTSNLNQNNSISPKILQNYQKPHQLSFEYSNSRNNLDQVKKQITDKNVFNQKQRVKSQFREIAMNENTPEAEQQKAGKNQEMPNQKRKIGKENNENNSFNDNYQEKRYSNNFKNQKTEKQFQNYWRKEISINQEAKEKEKLQDQQEIKEHCQQEMCQEQAILRNPYINI